MSGVSSPPSESNGSEALRQVTPAEQNATSTVANQIRTTSVASGVDDSDATKIIKGGPHL